MNCHLNSAVLCVLCIKVIALYYTLAHSDETHIGIQQNHFSNEFVMNGYFPALVTAFKEKTQFISLNAHNESSVDIHLQTGSSYLREMRRANIKSQRIAMKK